jgi:hypothetical protein
MGETGRARGTCRFAGSRRATTAAAAAIALLAAASAKAEEPPQYMRGQVGSTLGTPDQIVKDAMATRIVASRAVQKALKKLAKLYEEDSTADLPDARSTLDQAVAATAMSLAVGMVNKDPDRPGAYWSITPPHDWDDLHVPLAGLMVDNTDNIYRQIPVDGAASYEIKGRLIGQGLTQETFILHNEASGATSDQEVKNQEEEHGSVFLNNLPIAPDGSFTITIDSSPANGRVNHITTDPNVRDGYIIVRDTVSDWSRENPVALEVRRLSGPPLRPMLTEAELAERAAKQTLTAGAYWLAWGHKVFYDKPANGYTHEFNRVTGWGFVKCGRYRLEDDEALVVHLDRRQAAYLGFQLSDSWGQGQAPQYIERTGSLNGSQARANEDASYTYVIAPADPGVHNWLDTGGLHAGTFCTRWQHLPLGVKTTDAVKDIKVRKLAELKQVLPPETVWVTPEQRTAQREARMAAFARRLGN